MYRLVFETIFHLFSLMSELECQGTISISHINKGILVSLLPVLPNQISSFVPWKNETRKNKKNTALGPLGGIEGHTYFLWQPAPSSGHTMVFSAFRHSNCRAYSLRTFCFALFSQHDFTCSFNR